MTNPLSSKMSEAEQKAVKDGAGPYKWYVLLLLFTIFICSYIDRSIMSILQLPIQRELGLSDMQLGLLTGIAFTLCYAFVAIPIGRLADRRSRKRIIAAILAIWSVSTILCGFATSFLALFVCRVFVAVGEGGCAPASMSMISDYFSRERRATAIALWTLSVPLGSMLGYALGGVLDDVAGWRNSFVIVGSAGLLLLPLILLTMREPIRGALDGAVEDAVPQPRFAAAIRTLWNIRSLRFQVVGASMHIGVLYICLSWNVPFLVRSHGLSVRDAAFYMSLTTGLGGAIGTFGAGAITDRLSRLNPAWYLRVPAIALALIVPALAVQLFCEALWLSVACAFLVGMLAQTYLTPSLALGQILVPPNLRAFTSAVQAIVVLVVAGAASPVVVGWLSDLWTPLYGADALRHAMATGLILTPIGVAFYLWASRYVGGDWHRAHLR
jgi:MFS family permease